MSTCTAGGAAGVTQTGHFREWPVTSARVRSLVRLTQFVRMLIPAGEGRCPR